MALFTLEERELVIRSVIGSEALEGFTISRELVEMALDAEEDAAANGTDHWPTLEEVEAEYGDAETPARGRGG